MQKLKTYILLTLLFVVAVPLAAQDTTDSTSNINWFYTACEDRMVMDLSGTIDPGYDVYFQAFDGFGGTGNALTGLRRVEVDGDYAISQVIPWLGNEQRVLGTPVSVVISMAREDDPETTIFSQPSDDLLGECAEPASTLVDGEDLTSGVLQDGDVVSTSGIRTPDGGYLNPIYFEAPEPIVQIGARNSDIRIEGRTNNPGLIFAQCADVPAANPGTLFDTDELIVFWSWYAKTAEQVESHIANSSYVITLNGQPFPDVNVSPIQKIPNDPNWWVFYTVNLGDKWRPGTYGINYNLQWVNTITDGYDDFGPGTANDYFDSGCGFVIEENPWNVFIVPENPQSPLRTFND
jgi:hypothetical protein